MKIRYILLLVLMVGTIVYMCFNWRRPTPQSESAQPVVEMVAQPEAPEAIAEADMENVSPEDAEKD